MEPAGILSPTPYPRVGVEAAKKGAMARQIISKPLLKNSDKVPKADESQPLHGGISSGSQVSAHSEAPSRPADQEQGPANPRWHPASQLRCISESTPAMLWIAGVDGQCTYISDSWLNYTGQTAADACGLGWMSTIHPEDTGDILESLKSGPKSRGKSVREFRVLRADGTYRWVLSTAQPLHHEQNGEQMGYTGSIVDIHDRFEARWEAIQSRDTFFDLIQKSPLGVYVLDYQLRIRQASARAESAYSSSSPLLGRDVREVMRRAWPKPEAEKIIGRLEEALKTGASCSGSDVRRQRLDRETPESYDWKVEAVKLPGEPGGIVYYFYETTDLRQAEAALLEADRKKDEFLAVLAHELRNPLAPILAGLQMLREETDPKTIEATRATMERQTIHLISLVDDLMDVTRIKRGTLRLRSQLVELQSVVTEAVDATNVVVGRTPLFVHLPSTPVIVNGDRERLVQLVTNLIANAAKYSKLDEQAEITICLERSGEDAVLSIRDQGVGIPAEKLDDIFEIFTQLEANNDEVRTGLGIGLALVKRIAELHNGTIQIASEGLNQGTKATVRLPASRLSAAPSKPRALLPRPTAPARRRRILIADDNQDAANLLGMMVKRAGFDVRTVYCGRAAVDTVRNFRPDGAVLDLGMPDLSGCDAARLIRQDTHGRGILLLALTGWSQPEYRRHTASAGFDHHIVKPADADELLSLLHRGRAIQMHG